MSKKGDKNGHKNMTPSEKVILVTAVINLLIAVIELIAKLLD